MSGPQKGKSDQNGWSLEGLLHYAVECYSVGLGETVVSEKPVMYRHHRHGIGWKVRWTCKPEGKRCETLFYTFKADPLLLELMYTREKEERRRS